MCCVCGVIWNSFGVVSFCCVWVCSEWVLGNECVGLFGVCCGSDFFFCVRLFGVGLGGECVLCVGMFGVGLGE